MGEFSPSLKMLPSFQTLTAAESAVFERDIQQKRYGSGESLELDETLLIVAEGSIRLGVDRQRDALPFAVIEKGGLVGELAFFEPDPVALDARAASEGMGYAIDRWSLKQAFRYSRTGAVKFMVGCAKSLSQKIRSANEVVQGADPTSLSSSPRPSQLAPAELQRLVGLAGTREYDPGDFIFREGDASRELFVIGSGEVDIVKDAASDGPLYLARLRPGDFFGEMAFVDEKPRSAAAVARSSLQAYVLPSGSLEKVVEYNVGMALYLTSVICKIMARRLNATLRRLAAP